jgi:hypothetical protein
LGYFLWISWLSLFFCCRLIVCISHPILTFLALADDCPRTEEEGDYLETSGEADLVFSCALLVDLQLFLLDQLATIVLLMPCFV